MKTETVVSTLQFISIAMFRCMEILIPLFMLMIIGMMKGFMKAMPSAYSILKNYNKNKKNDEENQNLLDEI